MLSVENIRSHDEEAVADAIRYLLDHEDPGVRIRPQDQLDQAFSTGQGFLVRDPAGSICGLSLIYQFEGAAVEEYWSEIGTMRVTRNGLGLQTFLARLHLLQISIENWGAPPPSIFAVVTAASASEHILRDTVGMKPWSPPTELATVRALAGVPFNPAKPILGASPQTIQAAVQALKQAHQAENRFQTPKGSDVVCVNLGWFAPELLEI